MGSGGGREELYISHPTDDVEPGLIVLNCAWFQSHLSWQKQENRMRNATTDRALNLIEENADTPRIINFSESANALDREAANVSPPESVRTRRFSPPFHYPSLLL